MTKAGVQEMLDELLVEDLSGVTFVRDYLQLEFNPPPRIDVYSKCRLVSKAQSATFGDPQFANLIIAQIGQTVKEVGELGEALVIAFANGSRLEIPFTQGTYSGPEAFVFWGRENRWGVWPS